MTEEEKTEIFTDLCYLSGCAVHGLRPDKSRVERMNLGRLFPMSRFHSLTNLVFEALLSACDGNPPDTPVWRQWREARDKAVTKNLLLDAERAALSDWMERAEIWYLPLKGCVLKELYPKSGMRQMADNDILFDAAFQERVRDWFCARGYKVKEYGRSAHDCYWKAPVYNFEMHTALFSNSSRPEIQIWRDYYKDVKRRLLPDAGKQFGYHFSDEDFYLYFTAHACKHYRGGGTGLRTLLDFFVYLSAKGDRLDRTYIRKELEKLRLTEFERQTRELAKKVFSDPESFSAQRLSEEEREMLDNYLTSGAYGTIEQRVHNQLSALADTEGGITRRARLRYVWGRLFPERAFMEDWCRAYAPFFIKHRVWMPFAPAWRILSRGLRNLRKWLREVSIAARA